ncbi:MAG: peptidylprolyl isomerase [Myxococcota bacterium]|nr:peptidylprolyl isomerase [Myxococcota bacterium]
MQEPLLWFLLLGLGLFGLDRLWPDDSVDGPVEISADTVTALVDGFAEAQGRAPTEVEIDALVESHADELRALREARALGLDRADPVVRRRLIQKLAFLDQGALPTPDDHTLSEFLAAHASRYARPPRTDGMALRLRPGTSAADARAQLVAGALPTQLGMPGPHPPGWTGLTASQVAARTDPAVGVALDTLEMGTWQPVESGAVTWLIRLDARQSGDEAALSDVRERVLADWQAEERKRRLESARAARRARWPTHRR